MNSSLSALCLSAQNPTMNMQVSDIASVPYVEGDPKSVSKVSGIVAESSDISKIDWDSFETSWDFKRHPLL